LGSIRRVTPLVLPSRRFERLPGSLEYPNNLVS
jgi:hypothetical protein